MFWPRCSREGGELARRPARPGCRQRAAALYEVGVAVVVADDVRAAGSSATSPGAQRNTVRLSRPHQVRALAGSVMLVLEGSLEARSTSPRRWTSRAAAAASAPSPGGCGSGRGVAAPRPRRHRARRLRAARRRYAREFPALPLLALVAGRRRSGALAGAASARATALTRGAARNGWSRCRASSPSCRRRRDRRPRLARGPVAPPAWPRSCSSRRSPCSSRPSRGSPRHDHRARARSVPCDPRSRPGPRRRRVAA